VTEKKGRKMKMGDYSGKVRDNSRGKVKKREKRKK